MKFTVLASGSKGNMTYIECGHHKILLDCGISLLNAKKRISEISFEGITEIFITHEHGDHVKFLDTVLKKTKASLYINSESFYSLKKETIENLSNYKVYFIEGDSHYQIDEDLEVFTLQLSHDAINTIGYIFKSGDKQLGYITDTGFIPPRYLKVLSKLDGLIIESNHDIDMLKNSDREEILKERILSPIGHLSNINCFLILKNIISDRLKTIVLAHISQECNCLDCLNCDVIVPLKEIYQGDILVASQNEATEIVEL